MRNTDIKSLSCTPGLSRTLSATYTSGQKRVRVTSIGDKKEVSLSGKDVWALNSVLCCSIVSLKNEG